MVKILCLKGHEYEINFEEPKRLDCDHDSEKVRGICIKCAMAANRPEPDPRCPRCGAMPSRIIEQPPVKIKILRS